MSALVNLKIKSTHTSVLHHHQTITTVVKFSSHKTHHPFQCAQAKMSAMVSPDHEVVCDVDTKCEPTKITLTFKEVSPPPTPDKSKVTDSPPVVPKKPKIMSPKSPTQTQKPVQKPVLKQPKQGDKMVTYKTTSQESLEMPDELKSGTKYWEVKDKINLKKAREIFTDQGALKVLHSRIEQRVQCACTSTDHLVKEKRTRLRELLLAEEVDYAAEYVAKCQQASRNRAEEFQRKGLELKAKNERERRQFAEQKLLEKKIIDCDPARPVLSQKILKELKKDQLWQIKEKKALEEARREEDRMFHDLMVKNMLAQQENEEENAKLAWIKQKEEQKIFAEQMKWKEQKEAEERQLKEYERLQIEEEIRLIKEGNDKETQERLKKKAKVIADMQEVLRKERETKERRKREEEEIDKVFAELIKLEVEKEKRKESSNKERIKQELILFLESSREMKRQREIEEKKCDEMLEELNERKIKQKEAERRRLKAARDELLCDVMRGRAQQVREKREREQIEIEKEQREIELLALQLEQQQKLRDLYEKKVSEKRELYKCQLKEQIKEVEESRRRKKAEEEEYFRQLKAEEEKKIEEVKMILSSVSLSNHVHPMKTIIKEFPPKYVCPFPCYK